MKITSLIICVLVLFIVSRPASSSSSESVRAMQILTPVEHSFQLAESKLKKIIEADDVRDRHIVVISIAETFRAGNDIILDFFLKYLYAQYKKHDASSWFEANQNDDQSAKWQDDQGSGPTGIWIWPEIFTHDLKNGDKVAIILLKTKGICDNQINLQECKKVLAINMMISSVQCYNLMENIKENDLKNIEMLNEFGQVSVKETHKKPFQKLFYIIRDWPALEIDHGQHGHQKIDELMVTDPKKITEIRGLRREIESNFEEVNAFLMPYPGNGEAQGNLDPEFLKYIKELTPLLFAPENLSIRKINGQKMRAHHFVSYLNEISKIFKRKILPKPRNIFMVTVETSNQILNDDYLRIYNDSMQKSLPKDENYINSTKIRNIHDKVKNDVMSQFQAKMIKFSKKLDANRQKKFEEDIEYKFTILNVTNEMKRQKYINKISWYNEMLLRELLAKYEKYASTEISSYDSYYKPEEVEKIYKRLVNEAIEEFDRQKMGETAISDAFKQKFMQHFYNVHIKLENDNSMKRAYFIRKGWIFTVFFALFVGYVYYANYLTWPAAGLGAFYGAVFGHFSVYAYHNGWRKVLSDFWRSVPNIEIKQRYNGPDYHSFQPDYQ